MGSRIISRSTRRYMISVRMMYFVPMVTGRPSWRVSWLKMSAVPVLGSTEHTTSPAVRKFLTPHFGVNSLQATRKYNYGNTAPLLLTNSVLTDEVGGSSFKVCIEVYYHCEDRALVLVGYPWTINVRGKVTTRPARGAVTRT